VLRETLLAFSAAVLFVACDAASTEPSDAADARDLATVGQLVGPWSPIPFFAAPGLLAAADRACRTDIPMPNDVQLVVVDVRGGGLAQVYYSGPNGAAGSCNDMKIDPAGRLQAAGGGSTTNAAQRAPLGQFEIRLDDISGSGRPLVTSAVAGPAGPGIARVEIVGPGQPIIEATMSNGWFAAWTPGAWPAGWSVRGFEPNGALVTTVQGP